MQFPDLRVVGIADLDPGRASQRATEFGLQALTVKNLVEHGEIEIVLNLTPPAAHGETSRQILAGGKHVWSEKPLAASRDDAKALLAHADRAGLRVACAPDTFLGGALQTAQRLVAAGAIGEPKSAVAIMQSPGPERVHPQPAFFYAAGGGPLLDMGPYTLTALVQIMGGIQRVSALTSTAMPCREVIVGPEAGTRFEVSVPTHAMALLEFDSGATGTMVTSFDSGVRRNLLEFYGTEAALQVPNPSRFEGDSTRAPLNDGPHEVPTVGSTWGRGVGVLDLARAIRRGQPERASGALAYHVLDVLLTIQEAADTGLPISVGSTVTPPEPLPESWDPTEANLRQGSDTDRQAAVR